MKRNPPNRIEVDDAWVEQWLGKLLPEIDPSDEDTIQARWKHGPYTVTIYRPYEDPTLIWTATKGSQVYGIGTAIQNGLQISTDIAAIVKGHQRKGIYRSVLTKLQDLYPEATLYSGASQTDASASLWRKLGGKDEGDAYTLRSNPRVPLQRSKTVLGYEIVQTGRNITAPELGRMKRLKSFEAAEWVFDRVEDAAAKVRQEEPLMMKSVVMSLVLDELFIRAKSPAKRRR